LLKSACAACAALATCGFSRAAGGVKKKRLVRVLYSLHAVKQPRPDWPNIGFDFAPVMKRYTEALKRGCPGFEIITAMARGPQDAEKIVKEDQERGVDLYVVFQMNCWNRVVQTAAATGKPVLYVDFLFAGSGGFLVYTAQFLRRNTRNVAFISSSRIEDVVDAVRCFERAGTPEAFVAAVAELRKKRTPPFRAQSVMPDRVETISAKECLERLREIKILAVGGGWPGIIPALKKELGITVVSVPFAELTGAYKNADRDQAREIARRWERTAARIEGVSASTLEDSAAMYLAQKALLKKHGAFGISINCLGGFYGGHISAYPCLGFHELNNSGLVGGCECDLRSAATMSLISVLTKGRPGMISDPVLDISKRWIVYAHCVAPNRVFGPQGPVNPFEILTHSEDRKGASVRSLMPLGYMTTTIELAPERKEILFHQGVTAGNVPVDRACRTKLAVVPCGDFEKLFRQWDRWGWHRVTAYGDLKEPIFGIADALGWKVLREA